MTEARARLRSFVLWLVIVTAITEGLVATAAAWCGRASVWCMACALAVAWSPGMAALIASWKTRRPLAAIGWRRPTLRMLALAYAIPLGYGLATYGVVWATGLGHFPDAERLASMTASLGLRDVSPWWVFAALVLFYATVLWLKGCISSLGEEIGWRGFLMPELMRVMPYQRAAILCGVLWAVWHFPLIFFGGYHGHTEMPYSLACFTVVITAMSFPLAWLRLKSGEVWTCTAFHASHNLFLLKLFNPLTQDTGLTRWFVSEFGIMTVIMTVITACWFRSPGRERG